METKLVVTMEFDDSEVADGMDQYMLDYVQYMFYDTSGRTTVELVTGTEEVSV